MNSSIRLEAAGAPVANNTFRSLSRGAVVRYPLPLPAPTLIAAAITSAHKIVTYPAGCKRFRPKSQVLVARTDAETCFHSRSVHIDR